MEERRRVLSCECQFVIGSYMFPEDLRDPESSTCPADFSIPVDAGRPPFLVEVSYRFLCYHTGQWATKSHTDSSKLIFYSFSY